MTHSIDPENKEKKPEDFTIPELVDMIHILVSEQAQTLEEIAELKSKLEDNQNE